ncbi:hypothetical protein JJB67_16910 [Clostridium perfringens]|uniref:hypothetical protein n=1 Tax=Clostridium perfringens TaxID=1502 RepID=UPI001ABA1A2B|nr:hypothetical protein [Clostridium perfringens]MBO3323665.1 hypothetical protein [Clostridium perfringens]MBO3333093.1 hypothetical protein [Clostridium perfringens]MCX0386742.1 hypothetical protein [Clostridium perfringens]
MNRKFELGLLVMTKGVQYNIEEENFSMLEILDMVDNHLINKSDLESEDLEANDYAIRNKKGRVFSNFLLRDYKIYIITDSMELEEKDRVTTILLAEEY